MKGVYAFTSVAADLNGDGWTDLYVASDSTPASFETTRMAPSARSALKPARLSTNTASNRAVWAWPWGFNGDGRLDLIKTNFAGDHPNVYRNQGRGIFEDVVLQAGLAVNPQYVGWGVTLGDLDNDGWQDVLQVNGHVYPELEQSSLGERYLNPRLVYRNLGNGKFEDVSSLAGPAIADTGRVAAPRSPTSTTMATSTRS